VNISLHYAILSRGIEFDEEFLVKVKIGFTLSPRTFNFLKFSPSCITFISDVLVEESSSCSDDSDEEESTS
jgi:hypothetical protein